MIQKIMNWIGDREWTILLLIVLLFVCIRLPAVDFPLHQDEYKWTVASNPINSNVLIPHPPLGEFIYQTAGFFTGYDVHFRYVPLFFGAINLLLLYYLMKTQFGRKEAIVASFIWIFSYYSVLASLMIDTDGQIMPFFFLLSLISYYKLNNLNGKSRLLWSILFAIFLLGGLLVKMSFILVVGAFIVDFLWSKKNVITYHALKKYLIYSILSALGFIVLMILAKYIFPFFDLQKSLTYWNHFINADRGWFQTFIQCVKAVFYASPFLLLIPFFSTFSDFRKNFAQIRVFIFFLIFSFVFYILLFDFSIGALDRYLQLTILPLTIVSSVFLIQQLEKKEKDEKKFLLAGIIIGLGLIILQFLPHYTPSLHPKAEWISRILSMKWNFVYPFSGGSGPLGFYVSFLFISLSWIISICLVVIGFAKPHLRKMILLVYIPMGIIYNGVFIEEYLFGEINGSAPRLVSNVVEFIKNNPEIEKVTVYNDNGSAKIRAMGKYRRRLYTDPAFDINEKIRTLNLYKEHYLEIDIPKIDPNSVYRRYLDSCNVIYKETDKYITATVYDCFGVPDIKL